MTVRWFARSLAAALVLFLPSAALASGQSVQVFDDALARGPAFLALAAFGFGLLVSLTPCVYPMITITVSVFGAQKASTRWRAFALSFAFMLGLVAMFTPLGITAGLTGKTFGAELSNPWVVVAMSAFFLALAASMFGAFDLDLPQGLKNRLASVGGGGYLGAFLLGVVCGPIAAPCTGPFLWGLLAWIAQTQSVLVGSVAMAAFAMGMGTPFFLVGALAMQLPKSGRWMLHVKNVMGLMLVVVALYFLGNAFPALRSWTRPTPLFLALCAAAIVGGLGLGAVHKSFEAPGWRARTAKGFAVLLTCVGAFGFISGATTPSRTLTWEHGEGQVDLLTLVAQAKQKAALERRPIFMDFTAAWCGACKEIENKTFPDERVQKAAGRFIALKMDMTDDSDPAVQTIFKQYGVVGLPTLLLFDSEGGEVKRFFGDFVTAEELVTAMERVN